MKQRRSHIVFSWLLLAVFAFAQLPFSLLHHHQHHAPCSLVANKGKGNDGSRSHFHTAENSDCFVCSGYLLKKDNTTSFAFITCNAELVSYFSPAAAGDPADQPRELHSSRAPPFVS